MKDYLITTIVHMEKYNGLKESRVNNDNLTMLSFKRNSMIQMDKYELLAGSGIYFLINDDYDQGNYIYVGQSTTIYERISIHIREEEKNFNDVFIFTNKDGQLSKTYIDYLEWHYIQKIKDQNIFICQNKDIRTNKPRINKQEEILVNEYIEKIDQLLAFSGIDFKKINADSKTNSSNIYHYMGAKLLFEKGNFYLLKESRISNKPVDDEQIKRNSDRNVWDRIINFRNTYADFLVQDGDSYVLQKDIKVSSCSFAACLVKGYKAINGWTQWKNKDNKTMDEVLRQKENK